MCGYTRIQYLGCGCELLSIAPRDTQLCDLAKLNHLVQGIDCAPAGCVLSNDEETHIAARQEHVGCCETCRPSPAGFSRGSLEDVLQLHAHTEDLGFYDEDEVGQVINLEDFIHKKMGEGEKIATTFEAVLSSAPQLLAMIPDTDLRAFLSQPGQGKYMQIYLKAFQLCNDLLPILKIYMEDRASNKVFVETFQYVREKAQRAVSTMDSFHTLLECLEKYVPSRPHERYNGSESRLAFAADTLKRTITLAGPHAPSPGFEHLDPAFKLPEELKEKFPAREKAFLQFSTMPIFRVTQIHGRRPGGLNKNIKNLEIEISKELLPDEQANDIEIERGHFPTR